MLWEYIYRKIFEFHVHENCSIKAHIFQKINFCNHLSKNVFKILLCQFKNLIVNCIFYKKNVMYFLNTVLIVFTFVILHKFSHTLSHSATYVHMCVHQATKRTTMSAKAKKMFHWLTAHLTKVPFSCTSNILAKSVNTGGRKVRGTHMSPCVHTTLVESVV